MADNTDNELTKFTVSVEPGRQVFINFAGWMGEVAINTCGPQPMVSISQPGMPRQTTGFTVKDDEQESED